MQNGNPLTDEEIVLMVQKGNLQIFGILIEKYQEKIKRYLQRFSLGEEANDITQTVFLKAFANIQSFKTRQKFSPWLYRIAHNELVNFLKKKKSLPLFDFDIMLPHHFKEKEKIENDVQKKMMIDMLEKCLDKLEAKYKEVFIFFYIENLSYQEISDITHLPVSTVGIRLKRAREKIKQICLQSNQDIWSKQTTI